MEYYAKYDKSMRKLQMSIATLEELLDKKDNLFLMTQPSSVRPGNIRGTAPMNKMDDYLIKSEEQNLDKRIEIAQKNVEHRQKICDTRREELRQSNELIDKIYYYLFVRCMSVEEVSMKINYSKAQVHRYRRKIKETIERDERNYE